VVSPRREDYTNEALEAIERAHAWASDMRNAQLDAEHLALGMLSIKDGMATKIFDFLGADVGEIKKDLEFSLKKLPTLGQAQSSTRMVYIEPRLKKVLDEAEEERLRLNDEFVAVEHLLKGLLILEDGEVDRLLKLNNITMERIYHALKEIRGSQRVTDPGAEKKYQALEKYSVDLTKLARAGKLDPVVGREKEIQRVLQTLTRRTKNNPVIIGDAGVGKTAIVEGLAQSIVIDDVPESLKNRKLLKLEMASLLAGAKFRGEFEERLTAVMDEIRAASGEIVLFIDEIHIVVGAGGAEGAIDAANMMKPALARGEVQLIGATTPEEYRKYIESDKALERRFTPVNVNEPDQEIAVEMLKILRPRYEKHHKIQITDSALESSVNLSARYITERYLPDKAIDLIDETGALLNISRKNSKKITVKQIDIEKTISKISKIPEQTISSQESINLQKLESDLKTVIFGQDTAIKSLVNAIKLSRAGLRDDNKTIGSFLFAGPTGVGKTEITTQLANMMGIELVRFDMSEYMERHTVSRLIGAPPGYVGFDQGGLLTEAVVQNPHCVLLLDEIEKAHPDIFNLLLQIMDSGVLTDNNGRKADFRNVIVVMTTNAGADLLEKKSIGFSDQSNESDALLSLKKLFSPEFRNRLDEIIQFNYLPMKVILSIVDKFLTKLQAQLDARNVELIYSKKVLHWIAENGYNKEMGARPMERFITNKIKKPLVDKVLFGELSKGGQIKVDLVANEVKFSAKKKTAKSKA